jgi:CRP/FNR family transcriptional regulator
VRLVKKPNGGVEHTNVPLPSFRYVPFLDHPSMQEVRLGSRERNQLALISTVLKLPPRKPLFLQGDSARWVFNVTEGAVCVSRTLPTGKRRVLAFVFPGDICGLARHGLYVNSARTISPVTVLRIPIDALKTLMLRNADLQFGFICKITHALRETQRQMLMLSRKDPVERVALFLSKIEHAQGTETPQTIPLTMSRADVASYLDLTSDAVMQALHALRDAGAIVKAGPSTIRIINRRRFQRFIDGETAQLQHARASAPRPAKSG